MKKIILSIEGMTCSACSNGLEKYLNKQEGIQNASVNLVLATASIEYDNKLSTKDLEKFITEAGFKSLGEADLAKDEKATRKWPYILFIIIALLLMYISMAHMWNLPIFSFLDRHLNPIIYSITLFIMTIPFIIWGFDIIKSGYKNFIHKMPNMDTLVTLGVIASLGYSIFSLIMIAKGNNKYLDSLYFESVAFVIYFIKLGRFIDQNAHAKTKDAIKDLVRVTPKLAKIKINNEVKEVTIDEVKKGDILVCYAGDKIAVDGQITMGETHTDESFITGESKPVKKKKGDFVIAGSINYDGIEYKAEKIGKDSTISEIVNLVVEATNTKAPIAKQADKICNYFVPIIIFIAILTFIISLIIGIPFEKSLTSFVTVLVVACPCALGLATPLAIVVSQGICAKNGILIKSSETLELASKINVVVFDKTGTLTNGNITISSINNYSKYDDEKVLSILGSMENSINHPIAKGVMNYIQEKKINYDANIKTENISGMGIKSNINKKQYYAGNNKLIKKLKITNDYESDEKSLLKEGCSIIYLIENNTIIALIGLKDTERKEAKKIIERLNSLNIITIMLTGDNELVGKIVAEKLGIKSVIADCLPKDKVNVINTLKENDNIVAMVGDGINDAPSLVNSNVGISISSGTDIATSSADVILMNNNLEKILDLIYISRKTLLNIKENLFWAFIYNICMIPIACGLFSKWDITINPMLAGLAMIFSSIFVALNSLRLKKVKIRGNK